MSERSLKFSSRAEHIARIQALHEKGLKAATTAAAEKERAASPEIGDRMPDGTIYAGISPTTHVPMYAAAEDSPGQMTYYTAALADCMKSGFRLPDREELRVIFESKEKGALKGAFKEASCDDSSEWYWSSTQSDTNPRMAWYQKFKDGRQDFVGKGCHLSVRYIRS
jgi:hypothetical protein